MSTLILDTNIVLDVFVFNDPAAVSVKQALLDKTHTWVATAPMHDELARVLAYPHIAARLAFYQLTAAHVLAQFDQFARLHAIALRASAICKDPDDQKFIDLAVAHQAVLLSKDNAVLALKKRLLALGCQVQTAI